MLLVVVLIGPFCREVIARQDLIIIYIIITGKEILTYDTTGNKGTETRR